MATTNIYLNFDGNCEEAFNFYKEVFETEFSYFGRFSDIPASEGAPASEAYKNKVMHVAIPIGASTLMGSDCGEDFSPFFIAGNNFSVSVNADSKEETEKLFKALSQDGEIVMPLEDTFWGDYFGMVTDKFGVNWMVAFSEEEKK